ncbi:MAG: hypothetical protein R3A48_06160 [Polyangiales bacterium]
MSAPAPLEWVERDEFLRRAARAWPTAPGSPPLTLVGWHRLRNLFVVWEPVPTPPSVIPAARFEGCVAWWDAGDATRHAAPLLLLPGVGHVEAVGRLEAFACAPTPEGPLQLQVASAVTHARDLASLLPLLRWDCEATPSLKGVVGATRGVVRLPDPID